MAIRFQHLLDSRTNFKVLAELLNEDELVFIYTHIPERGNPVAFVIRYVERTSPPRVTRLSHSREDFSQIDNAIVFTPTPEPTMSNKAIFEAFLKHHRAFAGYRRELTHSYEYVLTNKGIVFYISGAFNWQHTSKGPLYWTNLSTLWINMVEDLNLNNR